MNPARFSQMMKYLTRAKKEKPDLPDVFPASKAPIPPKTQNVKEMEAVNEFMLRNPRVEKAGGGRIELRKAGAVRKPLTTREQKIYDNYVKARKDVKLPSVTDNQKVKYKSAVRSGKINNNTVKNLKEKFRYENETQRLRYDTKLKRWEKQIGREYKTYVQKPNETKSQFLKRVENIGAESKVKARKKQDVANTKVRNYIDNWTTNWFDNNLNKYGVRDFDKMTSNLKKDWQKQIKNLDIDKGFMQSLSTKSGLPNVTTTGANKFNYNNIPFYTSAEVTKAPLSQWRNLFLKNKIDTAPGFKQKILDYFNFINQDKRGLYRQADGQTIKAYKDIMDKDVVYLLSPDANLLSSAKYNLFNSVDDEFSNAYNSYSNKINTSKQWKESAAKIEKTLGLKSNFIKNSMDKEKKALAKIFNVKQLPEELRYTLEHGQGLSAAAKTGNKEIMQRAVNDLIGTTVKQNSALGFGGFEANRNALVRDITAGVNVEDNLKSLNQLSKNAYKDFGLKGNMYSIKDSQLTSKPISTALTQEDRFGQYFKEIAKTKEGAAEIKKQAGSLENLLKTIDNSDQIRLARIGCPGKATGGRVGYFEGQNLTACAIKGVEKIKNDPVNLTGGDQQNLRALGKSGKAIRFLKNILGPAAIAGELIFEGGFAANKFMSEGVPLKQALGESYINKYLLGPKTQIDVEAEREKEFAKGEDFAMAKRGERMAPFMAQSKEADTQRLKKREEEMKALYPDLQFANPNNQQIDQILKEQKVFSPFTLGFGMQQMQPGIGDTKYNEDAAYQEIRNLINKNIDERVQSQQMQNIADAGGIANLAGGGIAKMAGVSSGVAPVRGPNPQGLLSLKNRVRNY